MPHEQQKKMGRYYCKYAPSQFQKKLGQAATELAIFGGIIIFLIGGIVRSAVSSAYQQNNQLKAMRLALLASYETSIKRKNDPWNQQFVDQVGGVGRNSASVLYIEDRLSPDMAKYGTLERIPFIAQGSGTLSNMLMYPLDKEDLTPGQQQNKNIPTMDVFINGKHFTFTTANLVSKTLGPPAGYVSWYPDGAVPDPDNNSTHHYRSWNFQCVHDNGGWYGCPMFYQVQLNPGDPGILPPAESFNLDRMGKFRCDPPPYCNPNCPVNAKQVDAGVMAWQWRAINALSGAFIIDAKNANYPSYDVDNDLQEETIYGASYGPYGIVTGVTVLDTQEGDIDGTYDTLIASRNSANSVTDNCEYDHNGQVLQPRPGLQNDMNVYTQTRDGTFLHIKEGKLFNPETGAFVRSVSKKDQVDVVRRIFQLSRDTGRMCSGGVPSPTNLAVEACASSSGGSCTNNIAATCFDENTKILFVSSRILDKRGRFWRTSPGALP